MQKQKPKIHEIICPTCHGKGLISDGTRETRARQGGNASYLKSLEPGQMSMAERGRRGGKKNRALTLADLEPGSW